jgi:hypothetical protein
MFSRAGFNGLSNCAVFPVPVSSLAVSIWNDILNSSSQDLCVNPYGLLDIPVSELLELTLPPVDAAVAHHWPKPLAHYCKGLTNETYVELGRYSYKALYYSAKSTSPGSIGKLEAFQQVFPSVKVHRTA